MWENVEDCYFEEKMMWVGVLRRAIADYVLYKGMRKHRIKWQRSSKFLFGGEPAGDGLTFDEVCGLLAWEPDYVRRKIRDLERTDIRKLESSKFREDFELESNIPAHQDAPRWEAARSTPKFTKFSYSESYRDPVTLRPARSRLPMSVPVVQWQAAVA
jgi:hypothetical protein